GPGWTAWWIAGSSALAMPGLQLLPCPVVLASKGPSAGLAPRRHHRRGERVCPEDRSLVEGMVLDRGEVRVCEEHATGAGAVERAQRLGGEEHPEGAAGGEESERSLEEEEREVDLGAHAARRAGQRCAAAPACVSTHRVAGAHESADGRGPAMRAHPRRVGEDEVEASLRRLGEVDVEAEERERTLVEERGPEPSELGEPATDVVCRRLRAPRVRRAFAEEVQRGGRGGEFTGSTDQPSFDAVE